MSCQREEAARQDKVALYEERKKVDKLTKLLAIEREANVQALKLINSIQNIEASDVSDPERNSSSRHMTSVRGSEWCCC